MLLCSFFVDLFHLLTNCFQQFLKKLSFYLLQMTVNKVLSLSNIFPINKKVHNHTEIFSINITASNTVRYSVMYALLSLQSITPTNISALCVTPSPKGRELSQGEGDICRHIYILIHL